MKICVSVLMFTVLALPTVGLGAYKSNQTVLVSQLQVQHNSSEYFANDSSADTVRDVSVKREQKSDTDDVQEHQIMKNKLALVTEEDVAAPSPTRESLPKGQGGEKKVLLLPEDAGTLEDDDNVFGLNRGYFHPFISLHLAYTDNLFNLDEDRTSNFLTKVSPGLWLSIPRRKLVPIAIATHNTSAGGLQLMLDDYEGTDRYQFYLKGGFDYSTYSADSDLNDFNWGAEGMGRYNFPGGLSLQIMDQYTRSQDRFEVGYPDADLLHLFSSNVLIGTADWDITEKLRIKGDVSLFLLRYDDEVFDYLERDDIFFDLYGYFNWSEKTSFFLNYKYGLIDFDSYTDYDNEQTLIYGGMKWNSTEKIALTAKVGIQDKQFTNEDSTFTDYSGLALETQIEYRYSEKTRLQFSLYKKNEETDSLQAQDKDVWGATFNYAQDYTDKLHGSFRVRFEDADYTELVEQERDEWRIILEPKLRFAFKDWINVELGYQYEKRDSTDDTYDYYSNTFFANLNIEL